LKKRPLIHGLFIYLFLIIFCECHQKKTNDGLNIPTKTESKETSKKTTVVEKPVVIYKSNDLEKTWSSFANGIPADATLSSIQQDENKIYAATQNGALMCKEDAINWKSIYEGDALHDINNDGKYIYAMTIGQELLKTENDGALWENAQNGIIRPPNFYTNELQHIGDHIFSEQWIGIYHSTNHGKSWEKIHRLPDATAFSTLEITDFGIMAGISIR